MKQMQRPIHELFMNQMLDGTVTNVGRTSSPLAHLQTFQT